MSKFYLIRRCTNMLKIQVLGKGMIPRGLGLAPRMEPFPADRNLIATILQTPSMSINYLHPENGKLFPLTRQNMKTVLEKYGKATYKNQEKVANTAPHTPADDEKAAPETEKPKEETPAKPPVSEPPKPVTPPQQPSVKVDPPKPAQDAKVEEKKDESKKDEPKADSKPGDKKDEKPATTGGLKPVVGQGQNAQK